MTNFLNTFRGKLLVVLAFLLIATLGVQLYLNFQEKENADCVRSRNKLWLPELHSVLTE